MLSVADIQNKEFKKAKLGGYNIEDVNEFLEEVSNNYQEAVNENYALKDKINTLNESVQYYHSMESTIQNVLVLADKTAQDTKQAMNDEVMKMKEETEINSNKTIELANQKAEQTIKLANEQAEATITGANEQASKIVNQCKKEALQLTQKVEDIKRQYLSYKAQFKQLLQSQVELLDQGDAYATIAQVEPEDVFKKIEIQTLDSNNEDRNNNEDLHFTKEYTPVTDDEISSLLGKAE